MRKTNSRQIQYNVENQSTKSMHRVLVYVYYTELKFPSAKQVRKRNERAIGEGGGGERERERVAGHHLYIRYWAQLKR